MGLPRLRAPDARAVSAARLDPTVARARDGDTDAWREVYHDHVERIYALCLRMTGSAEEAEERTQDVFVRAWEKLGQFRGDSRLSTWLHRLAVNVVLQSRRSSGRRRHRERSTDDLERYGHEAVRAMPGTRVDLERAIAGLPDGARRMLVLRDVQGYAYREIAEIEGVSLGTVKAQIHRARSLVREFLDR